MQDELFQPTIHDRPVSGKPPWRPQSILYPGFFGGPLAAAVLGVVNGRRGGLPPVRVALIAAAGLIAFGARFAVSAAYDGGVIIRMSGYLAGIAVALLVLAWQRQPFRTFSYGGGDPASLVRPGLLAAVVFGLLEAGVIFGLLR